VVHAPVSATEFAYGGGRWVAVGVSGKMAYWDE
jgi:hypothetical protein